MTREEAIVYLTQSRGLAIYLLANPNNISLYPNEGEIILGVHEVIEAGYAHDTYVRAMANLSNAEFKALENRLAYHYARGQEPLEYFSTSTHFSQN